jgi:hypothetical protein
MRWGSGKRLAYLGEFKYNWEDNINTDIRKTGYEDVDWIHLVKGRVQWRALVNTVMNIGGFITGGEISQQLSHYNLLKKDSNPRG